MPEFRPAQTHGAISEVFPDVFSVTGRYFFARGIGITRNMTLVRQQGELVAINSVRLSEQGERELEALGKLTHVVRTGFFHGSDDAYYAHRYGAKLWAREGTASGYEALSSDHSPLSDAQVFAFEKGLKQESVVLLARHGGICVPCDSYQNWTQATFDGCSFLGKWLTRAMGFGPTIIGGPWLKAMGPSVRADFERLLEAPFAHLIPAHGTVLKDDAHAGLEKAIAHRFGSSASSR
ncbi:MAG TPA: hypothetical protein VGI10_29475 [Polyangiaceae bacterium]|jgi:hypothetical protein